MTLLRQNANRSHTNGRRTLRIGVTGHRLPPKLPEESTGPIRATIDRVLGQISDLGILQIGEQHSDQADSGQPNVEEFRLEIVSSLAQGADQIVAEAGLARGSAIDAILPFHPEEYRLDFKDEASQQRFDDLLLQCRSSLALDYSRDLETSAYEAAGLLMLSKSDLLIAIWDEEEAAGRGGTAQIVGQAVKDGVPILHINPETPEKSTIRWAKLERDGVTPQRFEELAALDPAASLPRLVSILLERSA